MRNPDGDWEVTDIRGRRISFNFCTYSEAKSQGCEHESFAFMKEGSQCKALTSDEPRAEVNDVIERTSTITKSGGDQGGIRLDRAGGDECSEDSSQLLGITIDVWCNPTFTDAP